MGHAQVTQQVAWPSPSGLSPPLGQKPWASKPGMPPKSPLYPGPAELSGLAPNLPSHQGNSTSSPSPTSNSWEGPVGA